MIVEWDPERPRKKITDLVRQSLRDGGIIVYPTDTLYGIGCDLFNIKAIRKLYLIKKMDSRRALSIICRDLKDVSTYGLVDDFAFSFLKKHLPGPYTFVLTARKIIPKLLMTERKEVGIRIPDHPVPVGLAALIDHPVINTTAKISGGDAPSDPRDVEKMFKGSVDLIIDGGIVVSEPSTVVRLTDDQVDVLRYGKGSAKDLLHPNRPSL